MSNNFLSFLEKYEISEEKFISLNFEDEYSELTSKILSLIENTKEFKNRKSSLLSGLHAKIKNFRSESNRLRDDLVSSDKYSYRNQFKSSALYVSGIITVLYNFRGIPYYGGSTILTLDLLHLILLDILIEYINSDLNELDINKLNSALIEKLQTIFVGQEIILYRKKITKIYNVSVFKIKCINFPAGFDIINLNYLGSSIIFSGELEKSDKTDLYNYVNHELNYYDRSAINSNPNSIQGLKLYNRFALSEDLLKSHRRCYYDANFKKLYRDIEYTTERIKRMRKSLESAEKKLDRLQDRILSDKIKLIKSLEIDD